MVDVNLEAINGDSLPKDLYLSLRVGEQQKFSKASNSGRTFKFSTPEDKRYGKLEIYRRVGVAAISLDTKKYQEAHELSVPVDDDRVAGKEVKYRFCLGGTGAALPTSPKAHGADPAQQVSAKVNVAKDYLAKHQLEQRLSEAMQAVLREQPDDPGAFLAQRLTRGAGFVKKAEEPLRMMQTTQAATLSQVCKAVPTASQQEVTAVLRAVSEEGQQKLDTVLNKATSALAATAAAAAPAIPKEPSPVPAATVAPAQSAAVSFFPSSEDMGGKLDYPLSLPRDYPMPFMTDKDPISTATLMIGPGMCLYANIGRPSIMIF